MKKAIFLAFALVSACVMAQTNPYYRYPAMPRVPSMTQSPGPEQMLRQGLDRLTGFLVGAEDASPEEIRAFIDKEIAPHFDFPYMAQWAGGPLYRNLDPGQRANLTARLRELFLTALARNLGTFAQPSPRVDIYPARPGRWQNEVRVGALVQRDDAPNLRLDFRFYRGQSGWRVFDVTANGTSAVTYYRNYFGDLLRRRGPQALSQ